MYKVQGYPLFFFLIFIGICANAQTLHVFNGKLIDSQGDPVVNAQVKIYPDSLQTVSDNTGLFELSMTEGTKVIEISHLQFFDISKTFQFPKVNFMEYEMMFSTRVLNDVNVEDNQLNVDVDFSNITVNHKNIYQMPSATGDFTKVLTTLPGVTSNNELSSSYAVRGGNYDENLVYVNGMKVYRPQIISAGRQEGLSFVNPYLVGAIDFSAGGWRAEYGDKLSSVLDIKYKEPIDHEAVLDLGVLGGNIYAGGVSDDGKLSYTASVRHKNTRYLLNSLETEGEYLPKFTDIQSYISRRIGDKTKIGLLLSSAINNYQTIPEFKQSDFGTLDQSFRLSIAFDGQENLSYITNQLGTQITHLFNDKWLSKLVISGVTSSEREYYEIESAYWLCDLNNNPSSNRFDECATTLGVGTNYDYGRNKLQARILSVDQKNEVYIGRKLLEFGISWDHEVIEDELKEYAFLDSADFVRVTESLDNEVNINSDKIAGFAQLTVSSIDSTHVLNLGVRSSYWSYSNELLLSPRVQYLYVFGKNRSNQLSLNGGMYGQHPFYRELRNREGVINPNVKAQKSVQILLGWDKYLRIWGRPFKINSEVFYKYLWDINPYDVDNVKIRYFATNQATAYAYGFDFRINGEFIEGVESWFSLGLLDTREDLNIGQGYVRRPTDQRINLGVFFQDHMPNNPTIKVNLNLNFGSGLPFGPPNNDEFRNVFSGDQYARVDVGFSKSIELKKSMKIIPKSLFFGLDILNLLGADNTISYTWINDVNNDQYAVPNALSARFFNVRAIARF